MFFHISEEHRVVLGPKLILLLQQVEGVNLGVALGVELPPSLGVLVFHVKRKFLAVDTDCLLSKLFSVFFDHLLTTLICDFRLGLGVLFFLLHAEEAHLTLVKTLFGILNATNIGL
jgi:hypothetical protein